MLFDNSDNLMVLKIKFFIRESRKPVWFNMLNKSKYMLTNKSSRHL